MAIVWQALPVWQLERKIGNVDDPAIIVDRVLALAIDPSGNLLATGGGEPSRSGELKLWNVADGKLIRTITPSHSDTIFGLDFSPDGLLLASGAADRIVKVFNVASGALANSFEGHTHHVLDVAWRGDGKMLASAGADCVIKFWDYASGDQLRASQPPLDKEADEHRLRRVDEQAALGLGRPRRAPLGQRRRQVQTRLQRCQRFSLLGRRHGRRPDRDRRWAGQRPARVERRGRQTDPQVEPAAQPRAQKANSRAIAAASVSFIGPI